MPLTCDRDRIRPILEQDRCWSAYALADLAPGPFQQSEWRISASGGLTLVYRGFDPPILIAAGAREAVAPLFGEMNDPVLSIQILPDLLPDLRDFYPVIFQQTMWRMEVTTEVFRPAPPVRAFRITRLDPRHLPALASLYRDGEESGESPDAFLASTLESGVFAGAWCGGELVASAGTHVLNRDESIGAIGSVYTRSDFRGRGLARQVTGAVARKLLAMGLRTVVLNVADVNTPARKVYERLGFRYHCPYLEGVAAVAEDR